MVPARARPGRRLALLALVAILLAGGAAPAMTAEWVPFECPLCHTHFRKLLTMSSTSWGQDLDLMPIGNASFPWPVARCPKCGLILYKRFTRKELAVLRRYVSSPEYQGLFKAGHSPHYLLARLRARLGADELELAHACLQASWDAHGTDRWRDYLTESVAHFDAWLRRAPPRGDGWTTASLVRGDILRQLGDFPAAEAHFRDLQRQRVFARKGHGDRIAQELSLIARRDSNRHQAGEPPPEERFAAVLKFCREQPGWSDLDRRFEVVEADGEVLAWGELAPGSMEVSRLVPRRDDGRLRLEASWSVYRISVSDGFDWKEFLDRYDAARDALAPHRWIAGWLVAGPGRTLRVKLSTSRDLDTWYTERFPLLRDRGLPGGEAVPRYEIELRCGATLGARLRIAPGGRKVLVLFAGGCPGAHLLDRERLGEPAMFSYFPEYAVVDREGRWTRNTAPVEGVACPPELCREPCADGASACVGDVHFWCERGKVRFIDLDAAVEPRRREHTCGLLPDGRNGILGLAGASCYPDAAPEDGPTFCAPGLDCRDDRCVATPDSGSPDGSAAGGGAH